MMQLLKKLEPIEKDMFYEVAIFPESFILLGISSKHENTKKCKYKGRVRRIGGRSEKGHSTIPPTGNLVDSLLVIAKTRRVSVRPPRRVIRTQ